jgi:hypothetical protein
MQRRAAIGMFAGPRLTRPERIVIEGNALVVRVPEHHCADVTIANRQCFDPLMGRLTIP